MPDRLVVIALVVATLRAAAPLLLAGLGELVAERSGVLNLGVEGMMLVGAAAGFIVTVSTGHVAIGLAAAALAGVAMAGVFAVLTLGLRANQVASGLALTIFGVGLSALIGQPFQSVPIAGIAASMYPGLAQASAIMQDIMLLDPLVIASLILPLPIAWFMNRTRAGLILRAVGESHDAAHALGYPVIRVRTLAVLFGGAMAGLGGASLSLAYTPMWTENMVAGRGWIALALVVFSTWKPWVLMAGALLFGFVTIAQFEAEAVGIAVPSQLLATLPYLATILVLAVISRDAARLRMNVPGCLGKSFDPGR